MPGANILLNSPAEIVRAVIIELGLGTDPTPWTSGLGNPWPVFVAGEPSSPDNCITVFDTVGVSHGQSMVDLELYQHYSWQARIRSTDHPTGWLKSDAIRKTVSKFGQQVVTGGLLGSASYLVWAVAKVGMVLPLGKETPNSKRSLFTLNGLLSVDELL